VIKAFVPYVAGAGFRAFFLIGFLGLGFMNYANGQEKQIPSKAAGPETGKQEKAFTIRVGVEEVRFDAVVVDAKGRPITDLTADDFEIYQDGQRQPIVSCRYITYYQQPGKRDVSSKNSRAVPPIPAPRLSRDEVRRTIVFLVHDLVMSFESVHKARRSLRKFVETQMQPGDAVAIMRTSLGNAALQTLSSDKRQLLAMIDTIQWGHGANKLGVGPLADAEGEDSTKIQMEAVAYCIKALQNMPGRKFLLLLTPNVTLPPSQSSRYALDEYFILKIHRLADAALRSGVVIHTLDIAGSAPQEVMDEAPPEGLFDPKMQELLLPLSEITGGLLLLNGNFFQDGIGAVENEMKGYYLLTYLPPANTFQDKVEKTFHDLRIEVKKKGGVVHTRSGFWGSTESPFEAPTTKAMPPLMEAMFSPFQNEGLKVNLVSGFMDDLSQGYVLKAWLHLDGKTLGVIAEKDGGSSISLETCAATMDMDGSMQDLGSRQLSFRVNNEEIKWTREHGLNFALSLPTKKPGAYYLRMAAKDMSSGMMGSTYQFIEIPDLIKDNLTLSSIFIINSEEDVSWIRHGASKEAQSRSRSSPNNPYRSQALRSYSPGDSFEYMAVIYNAKAGAGVPPDLEAQVVLFRNGERINRSNAQPIDMNGVSDYKRIPIRRKLLLENSLQSGDYVLQLEVRDKQAKKNNGLATQTLQFEISKK
jgi:VWFA-related protein